MADRLSRLWKGERERAFFFLLSFLFVISWFLLGGCPLPLGAWDRLRNFIVAFPVPSIYIFCMILIL